jgi:hypothetical protein
LRRPPDWPDRQVVDRSVRREAVSSGRRGCGGCSTAAGPLSWISRVIGGDVSIVLQRCLLGLRSGSPGYETWSRIQGMPSSGHVYRRAAVRRGLCGHRADHEYYSRWETSLPSGGNIPRLCPVGYYSGTRAQPAGRARWKGGAVKLVRVATSCGTSTCPTVYSAGDGDVVVQGFVVPDPAIEGGLPQGETVVRVPLQLIIDAASQLQTGP